MNATGFRRRCGWEHYAVAEGVIDRPDFHKGQIRYGSAAEHLQHALTLYRQLGNRDGEAGTLAILGTLYTRLGQPTQATEHLQQALAMFRETGQRDGEAGAFNGLGEAAHTAGHPTDAITHHTAALTIATDTGNRYQQARGHTGLGHAHHTLNNPERARQHYQHALTVNRDIDTREADQIRVHLSALDEMAPNRWSVSRILGSSSGSLLRREAALVVGEGFGWGPVAEG